MKQHATLNLFCSTDYKIFRRRKDNREIDLKHVEDLKKSLQQCNDLKLNPLIVNPAMEIVDGQHRLKAAEELGYPVYYIIDENFYPEKIKLYNTVVKQWDKIAFLNSYATSGNKSYDDLKKFTNQFNLSVGVALIWTGQGSVPRKDFAEGNYKFQFSSKMEIALQSTLHFINLAINNNIIIKKTANTENFHRACRQFFSSDLVDKEHFFSNLTKYGNKLWDKCTTTTEYIHMFVAIYNHRKQSGKIHGVPSGNTCRIIKGE